VRQRVHAECPHVAILGHDDSLQVLHTHDVGRLAEGNLASVKDSLESTAANGRLSVVECYALGLDPEVATDDLVITEFPMKANGTPDLANLKYEPSADKWTLPGIAARVLGAPDLAGPWQEVQGGDEASLRFFKVVIVVP
jgi:hypothetical protein